MPRRVSLGDSAIKNKGALQVLPSLGLPTGLGGWMASSIEGSGDVTVEYILGVAGIDGAAGKVVSWKS